MITTLIVTITCRLTYSGTFCFQGLEHRHDKVTWINHHPKITAQLICDHEKTISDFCQHNNIIQFQDNRIKDLM